MFPVLLSTCTVPCSKLFETLILKREVLLLNGSIQNTLSKANFERMGCNGLVSDHFCVL